MGNWVIEFTSKEDGAGSVTVSAVNKVMAWDIFSNIVKENRWEITSANCRRVA